MSRRTVIGRVLLGVASAVGLAGLASNLAEGAVHWRGHATTLAAQPGAFWFLVAMNGALFAGLMLWAISGRGFERPSGDRKPEP
jgi:hypothetical protein